MLSMRILLPKYAPNPIVKLFYLLAISTSNVTCIEHVNAALPKNITSRLQLLKKMCQQEINVPVRMAHVKQSNLLSKQGPTNIQLKMRMRMTMVCHLEILKKQYDMIL